MSLSQHSCTFKTQALKSTKELNRLFVEMKAAQCVWNTAFQRVSGAPGRDRRPGRWTETRPPRALQATGRVGDFIPCQGEASEGPGAWQWQTSWAFLPIPPLLPGGPAVGSQAQKQGPWEARRPHQANLILGKQTLSATVERNVSSGCLLVASELPYRPLLLLLPTPTTDI